jgi:hypothetical protein
MVIYKSNNIPSNEIVYLKKGIFLRVVEPWKNEDGTINWFNLLMGGKKNLFILFFIMIFLLIVYLGINNLIDNYKTIANNPCGFCSDCQIQTHNVIQEMKLEANKKGLNITNLAPLFK